MSNAPATSAFDPLAANRREDHPPLDVLLSGTVFFDLVFTGLDRLPNPGEELWSTGMGSCPGGIANLATATARLGLRTGLVAGFGDDAYGDWMWQLLGQEEGIDLSASRQFPGYPTPTTVSISTGDDRAMVTHGQDLPEPQSALIANAPAARTALVDLAGDTSWWQERANSGTMIFADIGFDDTGRWDLADLEPLEHCFAFTPNVVEAMGYTRTSNPRDAVRALAQRVSLAIVTAGADGSYAIDASTGEEAYCPALLVEAVDPTGAGDVFGAGIVVGTLAQWPLVQRLRFASLCSALAVQHAGGSLAAPGWADIAQWWQRVSDAAVAGDASAQRTAADYAFLDPVVPRAAVDRPRRAATTFTFAR